MDLINSVHIGGMSPGTVEGAMMIGTPSPTRGCMGTPATMAEPLAKMDAACREVGRDPATLGVTAFIGLWFPDLQSKKPSFFDHPLTGTTEEIAAAMRGYAELGVRHIIFQCEPYTPEALRRVTEALQLYRAMEKS